MYRHYLPLLYLQWLRCLSIYSINCLSDAMHAQAIVMRLHLLRQHKLLNSLDHLKMTAMLRFSVPSDELSVKGQCNNHIYRGNVSVGFRKMKWKHTVHWRSGACMSPDGQLAIQFSQLGTMLMKSIVGTVSAIAHVHAMTLLCQMCTNTLSTLYVNRLCFWWNNKFVFLTFA